MGALFPDGLLWVCERRYQVSVDQKIKVNIEGMAMSSSLTTKDEALTALAVNGWILCLGLLTVLLVPI
ncbi:hypothetical protein J6590_085947 [Homalodisca vitripennis]|nr:hypothetical protein J6590_085947 [Homalodisca vitripennis]